MHPLVRTAPAAALLILAAGCAAPRRQPASWQAPSSGPWPAYGPAHAPAPAGAAAKPQPVHAEARPSQPRIAYCTAEFQAQFGWPDPEKAAKVCQCESSGNPRAVSGNRKYLGLFQFSAEAWQAQGGGDVFDPYTNSHHAHRLFLRRGWRPWPHCGRR